MSSLTYAQNIECKYISAIVIPEDVKDIEDVNIRNTVINKLSNRKQFFSLKYSKGEYLFEPIEDTKNEDQVMSIGENSTIYLDINKDISISQESILDRIFLIKETVKKYTWDITTEMKEILGKKCIKATLKGNSSIVAWFTTEIPVSIGPMGYYGLPGLILQLETQTKNFFIQEVSLANNELLIEAPNKGKKISREDFNTLMKKKQESLGVDRNNGSKIKIIKM